jgi:N,N'-diacetyllegionaminate synthase
MADMIEIKAALDVFTSSGLDLACITVLHCNTEYPTPIKDVNLRAMQTINRTFKVKTGYSDHTMGIEIPIAAVAMGATLIEMHFTLDRNMDGPDHKASLEPEELEKLVIAIRNTERARGDGIKRPTPTELKNITVARRSIHYSDNFRKGHILKEEDLVMKRPGDGLSPMIMGELISKKLTRNVSADTKAKREDLM